MNAKVLVVEHAPSIAHLLDSALAGCGYQVRLAADTQAALAHFDEWHPDVVIADFVPQDVDGIALCVRIRTTSKTPVIILSAIADEGTKVAAFDAGANDYVTKPFGHDELLARVRVALRRCGSAAAPSTLSVGHFTIDFDQRRVQLNGTPVRLTPKEFDLFVLMARNPNRVLTHRRLLGGVWGQSSESQPEYLRVFISQLRKKLDHAPVPRYIVTEPWVGYRLNPTGAAPVPSRSPSPDGRATAQLPHRASA
jgi:two-component system, OmpR family, KDP operon response regulator KdpE